ncbi:hypothetical protein IMSHALPRED_009353 [Imshaugia aleurites]|uniref:Uncharacterized protein n=1 Tax=Imshaugia aleurites TaxID=172621 RepID=A0A8H3IY58_9LECA|nr:hypothetical protein IMSHALPRED_009353 [Imshaugia aleurites]
MGFRLIWDHADVIVSSILAYQRTSEYYANMSMRADGEFGSGPTVVITYGVFRLTFAIVADAVMGMAAEFAELLPNGFGEFVKEFALLMYLISLTVVIGTYTVLALAARVAVWITMVIVDNADLPRIVSGP